MRAKSFQIILAASLVAALTHSAAATDSPFHLGEHHIAPLTALNEALALMGHTDQPLVSSEELELFKNVAARQTSKWGESDVILIVSGVTDKATRERYIAKLKKITEQARQAVANAETPEKKAALLAMYLYKDTLHGGFVGGQVDMQKLVDTGKYNCVSSAILFDLVGQQVGLKTRVVTIPEHVFLRMGDLIIEPTCGATQALTEHQEFVDQLWAEASDSWKKVFGNTRTFESGNLGLISEIYIDDCNAQIAKSRNEEAVASILKAACLAPKHPVVAYQVEVMLRKWFNATLKQNNYNKAQKIASIYGQLFGDDSSKLFKQIAAARNSCQLAKS